MRASIAYFAGAGTIVAAIAIGLGGGLVMGNVMNPHESSQRIGKVEQRAVASQAPQSSPSPTTVANASPAPVPYLAQIEPAAKAPVVVASSPDAASSPAPNQVSSQASNQASKPQPQAEANNAQLAAKPQEASTVTNAAASSPDNAYARARDEDLKRLSERRKTERHQQWARRQQQREQDQQQYAQDQQQREQEMRASDRRPREVIVQRDDDDDDRPVAVDRPMRTGFPLLNMFAPD